MERLLQTLVGGVTAGAVYAIVAVSLTLVFNVSGVLNLSTAEFAVLAALGTIALYSGAHVNLVLSVLIVLALAFVGGAILHEVAAGRVSRKGPSLSVVMMITLGMSLLLRGVAQLAWGTTVYSLRSFSGTRPVVVGGVAIPTQTFWVIGIVGLLSLGLWLFLTRTLMGKAFISCTENPAAASLMGVDTKRVTRLTFAIGGLIAALAGVVIAPITFMTYDSGLSLLLNGFVAAAIGGLGKSTGALVGGLFVGVAQALVAGYLSTTYEPAIVLGALLAVLIVRPGGLLGSSVDVALRA